MQPPTLTIDVFSDVVCPWCYLGKRRLERALARLPDRQVVVSWHPFQLDPTVPRQGILRETYLERKFGSVEAVEPTHQRLTELGKNEGIDYRFDLIRRSPNTLDAHRLVHWAAAAERQPAMVERLFRAYFTEGQDVGDRTVLAALAAEVGIGGEIDQRLASDEDVAEIERAIAGAARIGVNAVPCFVFHRRLGVMGAQSPEVLLDAIGKADAASAGAAP